MSEVPNYPLPWNDDDGRMSDDLISDVRTVLLRHGYPELTKSDVGLLEVMLVRFVYAPRISIVRQELGGNPAALDLNVMEPVVETPATPMPSDQELAEGIDRWYEENH